MSRSPWVRPHAILTGVILLASFAASGSRADTEVRLGLETQEASAIVSMETGRTAGDRLVQVPIEDPAPPLRSRMVPLPGEDLQVEFWSDPTAGSLVRPGRRARLYYRTSEDCYITLISVDTEGRIRLLYPALFDEGWVLGNRTHFVPDHRNAYELTFTGPPGMEYVYAIASRYPMRPRFPDWLFTGQGSDGEYWEDEETDPYDTGWIVGDPFYQIREFCRELVPYPEEYESYSTAYVYFQVGQRVDYPRYLCSDCHAPGWADPYGPVCPAVQLRIGSIRYSGWIDFRVAFDPFYRYEVSHRWRPRGWSGSHWNGPNGRWVWSSADDRREIRRVFRDARPREGVPGDKPERPEGLRVPDVRPGHRPPGMGAPGSRDLSPAPTPERVVEKPPRTDRGVWHRTLEDRLVRAIRSVRGPDPDNRTKEDRPAVNRPEVKRPEANRPEVRDRDNRAPKPVRPDKEAGNEPRPRSVERSDETNRPRVEPPSRDRGEESRKEPPRRGPDPPAEKPSRPAPQRGR